LIDLISYSRDAADTAAPPPTVDEPGLRPHGSGLADPARVDRTPFASVTDPALDARQLLHQFAVTGRQEPFEEVVRRYGGMVYNLCHEVTGNRHDAEDATQAAFLSLAVQVKAGQQIQAVGPWLQQVARRMSLDLCRSRKRRKKREERHGEAWEQRMTDLRDRDNGGAGAHGNPASAAGWEETRHVVQEELNHLPPKYRMPLVLHYYGGMSRDDMARELNVKANTLGVRLHRGRDMLAKRLAKRGVTLSPVIFGVVVTEVVHSIVSDRLVANTAEAAVLLSAGHPYACGVVAPQVVAMAHDAVRAIANAKVKLAAAFALLAGGAAAAGAQVAGHVGNWHVPSLKSIDVGGAWRWLTDRPSLPRIADKTNPDPATPGGPTPGPAPIHVATAPPPPTLSVRSFGGWVGVPLPLGPRDQAALPRPLPYPVHVDRAPNGYTAPPPVPGGDPSVNDNSRLATGGGNGGGGNGGGKDANDRPLTDPGDREKSPRPRDNDGIANKPKKNRSTSDDRDRGTDRGTEDRPRDHAVPPGRGGVKPRQTQDDKKPASNSPDRPDQPDSAAPSNAPRPPRPDPLENGPEVGEIVEKPRPTPTRPDRPNHNHNGGNGGVGPLPPIQEHAGPKPPPPPEVTPVPEFPGFPPVVPPIRNSNNVGESPFDASGGHGGFLSDGNLHVSTAPAAPGESAPSLEAAAAGGTGNASFGIGAGQTLVSRQVAVGDVGAGVARQVGGVHTVDQLFVGVIKTGRGLVEQTGGELRVTASPGPDPETRHAIQIGVGGDGQYLLGNAQTTGRISELGVGGVDLTVGVLRGGKGTLRGWGNVALTGTLANNGKIVADGYGHDRTLDLSTFAAVRNDHANRRPTDARGWYAVNGGRLALPSIPVLAGPTAAHTWGGTPDDDAPTLVNSVRLTHRDVVAAGTVDIALLALDRADVPTLPTGHTFLGVWSYAADGLQAAGGTDLLVRYDDALAAQLGLDESVLKLWKHEDGQWTRLDHDETFLRDPNLHTLFVHTDLSDTTHFAVSAPEPGTIALLAGGLATALLRRRRQRH
jgi:RNA polymerase sigma factor (sigma-70 family)